MSVLGWIAVGVAAYAALGYLAFRLCRAAGQADDAIELDRELEAERAGRHVRDHTPAGIPTDPRAAG